MVNEEDIAQIVASWTGVPVQKLTESESVKLLNMEETLHQRLIGQDEAVKAVSKAIRRARVGLKNPNRPIASFIFSGPTGVGKTELTKALATYFFGSEEAMIRLDMSEFMERHTVSKLIGSPPGYVGFNEGGQLTEAVRRRPYTVVLFDEIEKAHPDVFNLLLQLLEDGRLTDSKGRTVDFKNTLIIMTSNIGSKVIEKGGGGLGFEFSGESAEESQYTRIRSLVNEELKQYFRPEFLNRLDEIIVFRQLNRDEVKEIAEIMLKEVFGRMGDKGITLTVSDAFKERLVEEGYNPAYGARPLRRAVMRLLEDSLAEEVLSGRIKDGDHAEVDVDENKKVVVRHKGRGSHSSTRRCQRLMVRSISAHAIALPRRLAGGGCWDEALPQICPLFTSAAARSQCATADQRQRLVSLPICLALGSNPFRLSFSSIAASRICSDWRGSIRAVMP